jgi:MFS family permease
VNSTRQLPTGMVARAAVATLVAFPALVIAANLAQRDTYDAAREAVSNLALGRGGWLMTLAFLCLGVGTLLTAVVVRRSARRAIVGPALLTAGGCTTLLSAVFQTDADGASSTLHGTIHIALGIGSFVLVIAAISASAVAFLRTPSSRRFGVASVAWAVSAFGAIALTFALPDSLFGIGQRAFLTVAVCWMLTTSALAIRKSEKGVETRPDAHRATRDQDGAASRSSKAALPESSGRG